MRKPFVIVAGIVSVVIIALTAPMALNPKTHREEREEYIVFPAIIICSCWGLAWTSDRIARRLFS